MQSDIDLRKISDKIREIPVHMAYQEKAAALLILGAEICVIISDRYHSTLPYLNHSTNNFVPLTAKSFY